MPINALVLLFFFFSPLSAHSEPPGVYRVPAAMVRISYLGERIASMTAASVERVVDGDTIVVRFSAPISGFKASERLRLIGGDTPESVDPRRPVERFGLEAARYARELLEGRQVRLAFGSELRDRYGRLLAYVFLPDGVCVNMKIIQDGYGFAYTKYPFAFKDDFRAAERSAKRRKAGLWAE